MVRPRSTLAAFGLLVWVCLGLAQPGIAGAAAPNWTVTAAPLVLAYGTPSNIDVTITGGTTPIGCVEVTLASADTADRATILVHPVGLSWTAAIVGVKRNVVVLTAGSDADRLTLGQVLTVEIQVTTTGRNSETWKVTGHQGETTSSSAYGLGSKSINSIIVVGAPTPTPRPTPIPTPVPAPTPTPPPTPTPSPRPVPTASPSGQPSSSPTPSPRPSSGPGSPTVAPGPPAAGGGGGGGGGPLGGGPSTGSPPPAGSGSGLTVPDDGTPGNNSPTGLAPTVSLGNVTLGSSLRWLIPTFAFSVPGMLIVGAIAIQLLTGLTFVELTRRWVGAFFHRRRRGAGPRS